MTDLFDFLIVGGDMRMKHLEKMLIEDGYKVKSIFTDNSSADIAATVADNIILPAPCSKADGSLNAPFSDVKLSVVEIIEKFAKCKRVFGGMVAPVIKEKCQNMGVHCFDYMQCESLTIRNAQATAEGALKVAIENTDYTLCGSKVLVSGYGRIGKLLSRYLKALGADVTVEARKETDLAWIIANGYKALPLNQLRYNTGHFDIIFNTVPYEIFTEREIINMNRNLVYIELASLPGGIDEIAAKRKKIKIIKAASLPGKTAPQTSAEAIKYAILGMLKEAEV